MICGPGAHYMSASLVSGDDLIVWLCKPYQVNFNWNESHESVVHFDVEPRALSEVKGIKLPLANTVGLQKWWEWSGAIDSRCVRNMLSGNWSQITLTKSVPVLTFPLCVMHMVQGTVCPTTLCDFMTSVRLFRHESHFVSFSKTTMFLTPSQENIVKHDVLVIGNWTCYLCESGLKSSSESKCHLCFVIFRPSSCATSLARKKRKSIAQRGSRKATLVWPCIVVHGVTEQVSSSCRSKEKIGWPIGALNLVLLHPLGVYKLALVHIFPGKMPQKQMLVTPRPPGQFSEHQGWGGGGRNSLTTAATVFEHGVG